MKKIAVAICFACICRCAYSQALLGSWPAGGGNITITPTDGLILTGGLEFVAESGILTQGASPAPFGFFIPSLSLPGNVVFGTLGTRVRIDGPVELDVAVSASAENGDITASWGDGQGTPFPVTKSVPEPASFLLAALGVIWLPSFRDRRRRE